MAEVLVGSAAALGLGAGALLLRRRRLRERALARLAEPFLRDEEAPEVTAPESLAPRHAWAAYAAVVGLAFGLYAFADWPAIFCLALTLIGTVCAHVGLASLANRRKVLLETQLTEAIDLVVGGLNAGAGTLDALDTAAREVREPLRSHLRDVVGAIRLGTRPRDAYEDLYLALPLDSYRLFAFALTVNEETGGSLAPTLAMVARSVRDNVELRRRIHSETMQAQGSVLGILAITYGIGLVTWQTHPERVEAFVADESGIRILAAAMILQALGLFWMSRMIKIRF